MPVEVGLWRIGDRAVPIPACSIDAEQRLEQLLADDLSMLGLELLLIGRQVPTAYGHFIDLLAVDAEGVVVVIELKRDQTPREVVAQLLDYGAWVRTLDTEAISGIFDDFLAKYHPEKQGTSLEEEFCSHFHLEELPEGFGESHTLMLVAGELDEATERIINYLADEYGVGINATFFRHFRDGDREYLTRAWLIDPEEVETKVQVKRAQVPWNAEYYVKFLHRDQGSRHWDDARKYGFLSASNATFEQRTLRLLEPGRVVWVHIPRAGYVGRGTVLAAPVPVADFLVEGEDGSQVPILEMPLQGDLLNPQDNPEGSEELLARVRWEKAVPISEAVWKKGFFCAATVVARPVVKRWQTTIDAIKKHWGIVD